MYTLFENNKRAELDHPDWRNASFLTFTEAYYYAVDWLGEVYAEVIPYAWGGHKLYYNGVDYIEIRWEG